MKKETTVIVTVELTKHYDFVVHDTLEQIKENTRKDFLEGLKKDLEFAGIDNINIANVQVFEIEKEERISTEDLIESARNCAKSMQLCSYCSLKKTNRCYDELKLKLADRLEELHNQQTATPAEQPKTEEKPPHFPNTHRNEKGVHCCNNCDAELPLMDEGHGVIQDININFCYHCGTQFKGVDEE